MSKNRTPKDTVALHQEIMLLPREHLVGLATRVATALAYDEESGKYDPESSVAAESGADFIEHVSSLFQKYGIEI